MFGGPGRSLREPDAGCRVKRILATYTINRANFIRAKYTVFSFKIEGMIIGVRVDTNNVESQSVLLYYSKKEDKLQDPHQTEDVI
jgi:ribosomal protein L5